MRFLGIDPGTVSLGLAVIETDINLNINNIDAYTYTPKLYMAHDIYCNINDVGLLERIKYIMVYVRHALAHYTPDVVCIESPYYNSRFPAAYGALITIMLELDKCVAETLPHVCLVKYSPNEIKSAVNAKSKGGKAAVYDGVVESGLSAYVNDWGTMTEHSIDAIAAAKCAMLRF